MNQTIVFFDGHCQLCHSAVAFLLSIDKKEKLIFSPLQGQTAKNKLANEFSTDFKTMVFLKNDTIYTKSNGVLEVLNTIGGVFSLFYIFKLIPRFIRDAIYDFISRNRIQWFGQSKSCRMPSKAEKARFLD